MGATGTTAAMGATRTTMEPGGASVTHDIVTIESVATGAGRTVALGFVPVITGIVGVFRR